MKVLIDTDALFGLMVASDSNHEPAKKILGKLVNNKTDLFMLNITFQETITVLSNKASQKAALQFIKYFPNLDIQILSLDADVEGAALDIFKNQTKNRTSFIDCANLAAITKYKLNGIVAFDEFYSQKLKIS